MNPKTRYTLFATLFAVLCASAQNPPATDIDALIKPLNNAGEGSIANAVKAFQSAAWEASDATAKPEARKTLNAKLCAALKAEQSERTQLLLLKTLAYTGEAECVPALKRYLTHTNSVLQAMAHYALQLNVSPEAAQTLRENCKTCAAKETVTPPTIEQYKEMLKGDETACCAGLIGLAQLTGDAAVPILIRHLSDNRQIVRGTAINALLLKPTDTTIQSLLTAYPQMPTLGKIACLQAFARHSERQAIPIACAATLEDDPNLKSTGIAVLGFLNDARAVPRLLVLMSDKTEKNDAEAATDSMTQLRGTEINTAVMALLNNTNAAIRATAVKCLGLRRAIEATPALFALRTSETDRMVRTEIPRALGMVCSPDDLQQLLSCVLESKTEGERDAYFLAYGAAGRRLPDPAMRSELLLKHIDSATREAKVMLIRGLGQTGGEKASQKVITYLAGDDLEFKDAAVRALASWADDSVIQSLVPVIKGSIVGLAPKHKVIALQGYLRMIALDSTVRGDAASMEMLRFAWSVATRPEEKNTLVSIIEDLRCADSFEILSPAVKDPTTTKLATEAAVKLGKFGMRRKTDQNLKATMCWLRDNSANTDAKRTAGTVLKNYFNE
jgi:HEAT repeat protein